MSGFASGERRERTHGQAKVKANAVEVAGADAGTGQDEQTVLRQQRAQLVDERQDRFVAAVHDGASADLYHLHPGQKLDRACAGDRTGEIAVEEGLARER